MKVKMKSSGVLMMILVLMGTSFVVDGLVVLVVAVVAVYASSLLLQ